MKYVIIPFLCAAFSVHCAEQSSIVIRPAQLGDIEQLNALSTKQYQNDLKPLFTALFPHLNNIEQLVVDKTKLNNETNEKIIKNQDQNSPSRLLVAEINDPKSLQAKIAGFCRFEQKDAQTIYMNFVLVDENLRKQGIARQLSIAAMNTFPSAATCRFRALFNNEKVNAMYIQHGCKQVGTVSLDLKTGAVNTDPDAPITHYDYEYIIQR